MNWRTPVAKFVFGMGAVLLHVKTYQPMYELSWRGKGEDEDPAFVSVGKSWQSIDWSWDLLELSERLDPRHWEHWALDHADCELECPPCGWCGGVTCYRDVVGDEP